MAKATFHIETDDTHELLDQLRVFAERVKPRSPQEPAEGEVTWKEEEVVQFWEHLEPDAREALRFIARQPEGVVRDKVLAHLKVSGRGLAGRLSSVGHALNRWEKRTQKSMPHPLQLGKEQGNPVYRMRRDFAEVVVRRGL